MSNVVIPTILRLKRNKNGQLQLDPTQFLKFTPHKSAHPPPENPLRNLEYPKLLQVIFNTLEEAYDYGASQGIDETAKALAILASPCLEAVIEALTTIKVRDQRGEHDAHCDGVQMFRPPKKGHVRPRAISRWCVVCARLEREAGLDGVAYAQVKRTLLWCKAGAHGIDMDDYQ